MAQAIVLQLILMCMERAQHWTIEIKNVRNVRIDVTTTMCCLTHNEYGVWVKGKKK